MYRKEEPQSEFKERLVSLNRVTKVVKGGKNSRFSVTVVVGDGAGHVGLGLGKSQEIPEAVRKATEDAKKALIHVPMVGTTIPHRSLGVFGAGSLRRQQGSCQARRRKDRQGSQGRRHRYRHLRQRRLPVSRQSKGTG